VRVRVDEARDDRFASDVHDRRPAGGITVADGPMAVIRPLVTTMVACSMGAAPVPSMTRAPVKAITPGAGICALAIDAPATKNANDTTAAIRLQFVTRIFRTSRTVCAFSNRTL
jgi:hypothetical protein